MRWALAGFVLPLFTALLLALVLAPVERWLSRYKPRASLRRLLLDTNTLKHRPARFLAAWLCLLLLWMACDAAVYWAAARLQLAAQLP